MTKKLEIPNINNIIKRYQSGISFNQLSNESGITRITLQRRFKSLGIQMRSQSESETLKWSKMSKQQRKRQVQKAHQSSKGRFVSTSEKFKRAKSCYENALRIGGLELEIIEILNNRGYKAISQLNFGIYNIDISVHGFPICIEIQSNNHNLLRQPKLLKRIKYILNRKQFLLYIIIDQSKNRICVDLITNNIITYLNILSADKTLLGKYSMIGRDGEAFPSSRYDFNDFPRIE